MPAPLPSDLLREAPDDSTPAEPSRLTHRSVNEPVDWSCDATHKLIDWLAQVRDRTSGIERSYAHLIERVIDQRRPSARNLLRYVSLRQQDLRSLQQELAQRGLSSLGRCEPNVHATLNAVIEVLCRLCGRGLPEEMELLEFGFDGSRQLLNQSTIGLFGSQPAEGGGAHIMVTMPTEAAYDRALVPDLLAHGMDCMRINCAHDDPQIWKRMIERLRRACEKQQRECKVLMDLGGPKLRTGPIRSGVTVLKWRPKRDAYGRVIAPARIWLRAEDSSATPPLPADATLPVIAPWISDLQIGDHISLTDSRGRRRRLRIVERAQEGFWAESDRTAYIKPDTQLMHHRGRGKPSRKTGIVGTLAASEQYIVLHRGERLLLGDNYKIGSPARRDEFGQVVRPATIGCTLPSVFGDLKKGDRVLFDDGKIEARVEEIHQHHVVLEVTSAGAGGTKLRADKGINLPDTDLRLDALTEKDIEDLAFVVEHADIVAYSFVRRPEHIERLQQELQRFGRPDMPIVLKIENRQAFEHLPSLLLTAMRSPASGVMIARGDLAVELGWQRLAEVQEEILWMCEAAHMPVVWATQVLESLAKTGVPSRAEITDAAMGVRAECVMLNKGPHILEAVRVLSDILRRMQDHQVKKRPMLRRLRLADDLMPASSDGELPRSINP